MMNFVKEAINEKIKDMSDSRNDVIYQYYEELATPVCTVIVKLPYSRFRIYQGILHSTGNISIKYMTIEEDMLKVMISSLKIT